MCRAPRHFSTGLQHIGTSALQHIAPFDAMLSPLPVSLLVVVAVLLLMLVELQLSVHNEKALLAQGAAEPADDVYGMMRIAYPAAFVLMGVEAATGGPLSRTATIAGVLLFGWAKALKFWAMAHLGTRWTFRVLVPPGATSVRSGPYRFARHPNYVAVIGEIVAVAIALQAPIAGVAGTIVFAWLIRRRIAVEERALASHTTTGPTTEPR
jgi:methyltransferase